MSKPIHNERNAGRKPMYNEPSTKSKSYTIPASKMQDFDEYAKMKIKEYMSNKGHNVNVNK
jgi:hypothetical protein